MNIGISFRMAVCISAAALLASCTYAKGYNGPKKQPNHLAVVRAHGVTLHRVNGIEIGAASTGVLILPGINTFILSVNVENYNSPERNGRTHELIMNAQAGKEYIITGRRGDGRLCAWEWDSIGGEANFKAAAGCISPR